MNLKLLFATTFYLVCYITLAVNQKYNRSYIVYCPCMGRFGNQAEQLLGTLLFAKALNRTLVLPPFIYYGAKFEPQLVAFDLIIKVEPIKQYHDVILQKEFLKEYPEGLNEIFCYSPRLTTDDDKFTCGALQGQPFETFWSNLNVTATTKSIFYHPLTTNPNEVDKWKERYSNYDVMAFVNSPSSFPALDEAIKLQKYIELSDTVERMALAYRKDKNFLHQPYISIHLRQGLDWKRVCTLLIDNKVKRLFSSSQCTGTEEHILEYEICFPSFENISSKLHEKLEYYREKMGKPIELVYIATDSNNARLLDRLRIYFPQIEFIVTIQDSTNMDELMKDIYLMAHSDIFIGNCVSSFSAFAARLRTEQYNLANATFYFGQKIDATKNETRDEL